MLIIQSILTVNSAHPTLAAMNAQTAPMIAGGLDGVVAAATRLSMVDGERGELVIAGHRLEQLSGWPFEHVVAALWDAAGINAHERIVAAPVPPATLALLRNAAERDADPMDALRMATGTLSGTDDLAAARTLIGTAPAIVA